MTIKNKTSGAFLASAAAALFMNGPVIAEDRAAPQEATVHCSGINACKGQSECKTATNACKGQNSCKGRGFLSTSSAEECSEKGGTVILSPDM